MCVHVWSWGGEGEKEKKEKNCVLSQRNPGTVQRRITLDCLYFSLFDAFEFLTLQLFGGESHMRSTQKRI